MALRDVAYVTLLHVMLFYFVPGLIEGCSHHVFAQTIGALDADNKVLAQAACGFFFGRDSGRGLHVTGDPVPKPSEAEGDVADVMSCRAMWLYATSHTSRYCM